MAGFVNPVATASSRDALGSPFRMPGQQQGQSHSAIAFNSNTGAMNARFLDKTKIGINANSLTTDMTWQTSAQAASAL